MWLLYLNIELNKNVDENWNSVGFRGREKDLRKLPECDHKITVRQLVE